MYKLGVYVPEGSLASVKQALFQAGAGRYQAYEQVCWQVKGEGQFKPLPGSNPSVGQQNQLARVIEYRVEMICEEAIIESVIKAMKTAHPYEAPAYDVVQLLDF
jgi:hypothetical protein